MWTDRGTKFAVLKEQIQALAKRVHDLEKWKRRVNARVTSGEEFCCKKFEGKVKDGVFSLNYEKKEVCWEGEIIEKCPFCGSSLSWIFDPKGYGDHVGNLRGYD